MPPGLKVRVEVWIFPVEPDVAMPPVEPTPKVPPGSSTKIAPETMFVPQRSAAPLVTVRVFPLPTTRFLSTT